jgi:hypothetical protein
MVPATSSSSARMSPGLFCASGVRLKARICATSALPRSPAWAMVSTYLRALLPGVVLESSISA